MTTKKTNSDDRQTQRAHVRPASAYHRLDALLHTIRCIAQYEDTLCELAHEAKRIGELSPEMTEELREILEKIPSHDYMLDLVALEVTLAEPRPSRKSVTKKPTGSVPVRKKPAVARKRSGRQSSR
jgi:hypothetical protein